MPGPKTPAPPLPPVPPVPIEALPPLPPVPPIVAVPATPQMLLPPGVVLDTARSAAEEAAAQADIAVHAALGPICPIPSTPSSR